MRSSNLDQRSAFAQPCTVSASTRLLGEKQMQIWQIVQGTARNTNKRGSQQVSTPSPIPMRCSLRWRPLTNAFRIPIVIRWRQTQFRRIRIRRHKREDLAWNARACPRARTPVFVRSDFKGGRGGGGPSGNPNETGSMSDPGTLPGCPKCTKIVYIERNGDILASVLVDIHRVGNCRFQRWSTFTGIAQHAFRWPPERHSF